MKRLPLLVFALWAILTACASAAFDLRGAATLETDPALVAAVTDDIEIGGLGDSYGDAQALVRELSPSLAPIPAPEPTIAKPAAPGPSVAPRPVLRVPVLMYHYIADVPAAQADDRLAIDLRVPPGLFEQHLAYLKAQGYSSVSTAQLWEGINGRVQVDNHPISVNFRGVAELKTE